MKRVILCIAILLALLCLPLSAAEQELRGVWVSTVYNLDYPSSAGLSARTLQEEAEVIVKNAKNWGLNALFLQVRACGDALYASDLQPWSAFVSGTQGQAPASGFDPLAYFTDLCHDAGIELHAWLNPYRLTRTSAPSREAAFALLCEDHPARKMLDCVIYHTDGCLYLDPGRPEVRQHLLDTVSEILQRYDVDGIHLDDYFYPGNTFPDEQTFARYGNAFSSRGDFRRNAVNLLVKELHQLVENTAPDAVFGVSPAGIWATAGHMTMGVETTGSESYFEQFADSRKWVREGMVDYIMPQIYWEIGAQSGDFRTVLNWWSDTVEGTGVVLYPGLAAYKAAEAENGTAWAGCDQLQAQLELLAADSHAAGFSMFRYGSVLQIEGLDRLLSDLAGSRPTQQPRYPKTLTVESPVAGQAVLSGETISITCTAPRASRVTAFYGNGFTSLKSDLNGSYSAEMPAETLLEGESHTAPLLICAEKHGILSVKLTSYTTTVLQSAETISIEEIRWDDTAEWHEVSFLTDTPIAASLSQTGDVLDLTFYPCRLGVLFRDEAFTHMDTEQDDTTTHYYLVLPDDGQKRQFQLLWEPEKITLRVRKTQPDLPEADP